MFFENMATAGLQVLTLFLLIAVGFIADKTGVFPEKAAKGCTDLLFYAVTPAVMLHSFLSMEYSHMRLASFFLAFVLGLSTHFVGMVLSLPFFRKGSRDVGVVYRFASIYGNMGYMCLPLAEKITGSEGVFLCSSAVAAYNVMVFTHGARLMAKDGAKRTSALRSLILNPGVLTLLVGLPLFIFSVRLPAPLTEAVDYVASLNSPLAMIILGTYIANSDLKKLFLQKEHYLIVFLKQLLMPLIMITLYRLIGLEGVTLTACGISAAAPAAANTVLFAAKYDRDTAAASQIVSFGTLAAVLTMPIMIAYTKL